MNNLTRETTMNTNKYPEKDIPSDCHCVHCIENTKKHLTKKEKSLTNNLFGTELICCTNCMGEGEINETTENATSELYEDCDICKGTGEITA
jgi:hypothetical protein